MAEKLPPSLMVTIAITILGWGTTFGICQQKIDSNTTQLNRIEKQHNDDYTKIESRQNSQDVILNQINMQLVEVNTKLSMLLSGKIKEEK